MGKDEQIWGRLARVDVLVSLILAGATLWSGVLDATPWPIRIASAVLAASGGLWLWRQLAFRRMLMPERLQPLYSDDVISIQELFQNRQIIRGITFRNCEIRGPGAVALMGPIMRGNTFSPHLETILVIIPPETSLHAHHQLIHCVFEGCTFSCGLYAVPEFAQWLRDSCMPLPQVVPPSAPPAPGGIVAPTTS